MPIDPDINKEIQEIFDKNTLEDLKRFLNKRQNLNLANSYLIYLFHLVQSAGILTTSYAAGSDNQTLVWVGVGLNILATLINVYEKTNNTLLKKLMNDIKAIKAGMYVDEGELVSTPASDASSAQSKPADDLETPLIANKTPSNSYQSTEETPRYKETVIHH